MNLNLFFISCSVICTNCYEVPKYMPTRYFDGREWKTMKPLQNLRIDASKKPNISLVLDWAALSGEIHENLTATLNTLIKKPPASISNVAFKGKVTPKVSNKGIVCPIVTCDGKVTPKVTCDGKVTPKVTPKVTRNDRVTLKVTPKVTRSGKVTAKVTTKVKVTRTGKVTHSDKVTAKVTTKVKVTRNGKVTPTVTRCGKVTINGKVTPQVTTKGKKTPKRTSKGRVTPKTKRSRVTTKNLNATTSRTRCPLSCPLSNKTTKKPTSKKGNIWRMAAITTKSTPKTTWITLRFSKRTKRPTTTKIPITTKKPTTKKKTTTTKKPKTKDPYNLPENWQKILREFLEEIKTKKESEPTPESYAGFLLGDGRRSMTHIEDLMNILMDGVEIDTRPDDIPDESSENNSTLVYDSTLESQDVSSDSDSTDFYKVINLNGTNVQYSDLKPYIDAIKSRNNLRSKENSSSKIHSSRDGYSTLLSNGLKAYLQKMRAKDTERGHDTENEYLQAEDKPLEDREIAAYLNVLKARYDKKSQLKNETAPLETVPIEALIAENNANHPKTRKQRDLQDYDIRKYLDAVKNIYANKNKHRFRDVSLKFPKIETNPSDPDTGLRDDLINKNISQDIDIKSIVNAFATKYVTNEQDVSKYKALYDYFNLTKDIYTEKHTNNSQELTLFWDEMPLNYSDPTDVRNETNKKHNKQDRYTINGGLSDRDITLHLDKLVGKDYKDSTGRTEVERHEGKSISQEADDVIIESKKAGTAENRYMESDEDLPTSNFVFALDDKEQNVKSSENKYLLGW